MTDLFDRDPALDMEVSRHKLFFALRPEGEAAARVADLTEGLRRRHGLAGWPTPAGRLHISLNGLGRHHRCPDGLVTAVRAALHGLAWPSFVVALDRCGSWGRGEGKRPVVLWADDGLIGARLLFEAIHHRLGAAHVVRGPVRDFNPHMTLLRDETNVAERRVEPVAWRVRELVLLDSVHGAARHEVLARWPLRAPNG